MAEDISSESCSDEPEDFSLDLSEWTVLDDSYGDDERDSYFEETDDDSEVEPTSKRVLPLSEKLSHQNDIVSVLSLSGPISQIRSTANVKISNSSLKPTQSDNLKASAKCTISSSISVALNSKKNSSDLNVIKSKSTSSVRSSITKSKFGQTDSHSHLTSSSHHPAIKKSCSENKLSNNVNRVNSKNITKCDNKNDRHNGRCFKNEANVIQASKCVDDTHPLASQVNKGINSKKEVKVNEENYNLSKRKTCQPKAVPPQSVKIVTPTRKCEIAKPAQTSNLKCITPKESKNVKGGEIDDNAVQKKDSPRLKSIVKRFHRSTQTVKKVCVSKLVQCRGTTEKPLLQTVSSKKCTSVGVQCEKEEQLERISTKKPPQTISSKQSVSVGVQWEKEEQLDRSPTKKPPQTVSSKKCASVCVQCGKVEKLDNDIAEDVDSDHFKVVPVLETISEEIFRTVLEFPSSNPKSMATSGTYNYGLRMGCLLPYDVEKASFRNNFVRKADGYNISFASQGSGILDLFFCEEESLENMINHLRKTRMGRRHICLTVYKISHEKNEKGHIPVAKLKATMVFDQNFSSHAYLSYYKAPIWSRPKVDEHITLHNIPEGIPISFLRLVFPDAITIETDGADLKFTKKNCCVKLGMNRKHFMDLFCQILINDVPLFLTLGLTEENKIPEMKEILSLQKEQEKFGLSKLTQKASQNSQIAVLRDVNANEEKIHVEENKKVDSASEIVPHKNPLSQSASESIPDIIDLTEANSPIRKLNDELSDISDSSLNCDDLNSPVYLSSESEGGESRNLSKSSFDRLYNKSVLKARKKKGLGSTSGKRSRKEKYASKAKHTVFTGVTKDQLSMVPTEKIDNKRISSISAERARPSSPGTDVIFDDETSKKMKRRRTSRLDKSVSKNSAERVRPSGHGTDVICDDETLKRRKPLLLDRKNRSITHRGFETYTLPQEPPSSKKRKGDPTLLSSHGDPLFPVDYRKEKCTQQMSVHEDLRKTLDSMKTLHGDTRVVHEATVSETKEKTSEKKTPVIRSFLDECMSQAKRKRQLARSPSPTQRRVILVRRSNSPTLASDGGTITNLAHPLENDSKLSMKGASQKSPHSSVSERRDSLKMGSASVSNDGPLNYGSKPKDAEFTISKSFLVKIMKQIIEKDEQPDGASRLSSSDGKKSLGQERAAKVLAQLTNTTDNAGRREDQGTQWAADVANRKEKNEIQSELHFKQRSERGTETTMKEQRLQSSVDVLRRGEEQRKQKDVGSGKKENEEHQRDEGIIKRQDQGLPPKLPEALCLATLMKRARESNKCENRQKFESELETKRPSRHELSGEKDEQSGSSYHVGSAELHAGSSCYSKSGKPPATTLVPPPPLPPPITPSASTTKETPDPQLEVLARALASDILNVTSGGMWLPPPMEPSSYQPVSTSTTSSVSTGPSEPKYIPPVETSVSAWPSVPAYAPPPEMSLSTGPSLQTYIPPIATSSLSAGLSVPMYNTPMATSSVSTGPTVSTYYNPSMETYNPLMATSSLSAGPSVPTYYNDPSMETSMSTWPSVTTYYIPPMETSVCTASSVPIYNSSMSTLSLSAASSESTHYYAPITTSSVSTGFTVPAHVPSPYMLPQPMMQPVAFVVPQPHAPFSIPQTQVMPQLPQPQSEKLPVSGVWHAPTQGPV